MSEIKQDIIDLMEGLGRAARDAAAELARADADQRVTALQAAADALLERQAEILAANAKDMEAAREKGLTGSMLDRLLLHN